jgi:hypothetical protein
VSARGEGGARGGEVRSKQRPPEARRRWAFQVKSSKVKAVISYLPRVDDIGRDADEDDEEPEVGADREGGGDREDGALLDEAALACSARSAATRSVGTGH